MNKHSALLITICSSMLQANTCQDYTASSKTYFSVRPLYQSVSPELALSFFSKKSALKENGHGGIVELVPFGSVSTKHQRLASYFMPYGTTKLVAAEDSTATFTPDLLATNFNIHTVGEAYNGTLCFGMKQSTFGLGLQYKQYFCWHDEKNHGPWISISSPLTHLANKVSLGETSNSSQLTKNPDTPNAVTSMTAAFNQSAWNYGKINANCSMKKTRLADIEAKLGYEWDLCPQAFVSGYVGLVIPTGNKNNAHYLFSPVAGNGGHAGLMCGANGDYKLWSDNENSITFDWFAHANYLFKNTQKRSFDLQDKPWSRYLEVYATKQQAVQAFDEASTYLATAGINVFTRDMKVTPGFNGSLLVDFCFSTPHFQAKLGYGAYDHQAEKVRLACAWPTGDNAPALKDELGLGNLNPFRTIQGNYYIEGLASHYTYPFDTTNYADHVITDHDLGLVSAAHPAYIQHTVFAEAGYVWSEIAYPTQVTGGFSYEGSSKNTTLNRWVFWLKGGLSF